MPVYPRWRGEHLKPVGSLFFFGGLSPLARGTRQHNEQNQRQPRFIPAGAGNTSFCSHCDWWKTVYPRWRGEHSINPHQLDVCGGLSPLARGTPNRPQLRPRGPRFIPAGAGNTVS
nr:hypothetical protein EC90111_0653 [Escherichia coli 9.0111]